MKRNNGLLTKTNILPDISAYREPESSPNDLSTVYCRWRDWNPTLLHLITSHSEGHTEPNTRKAGYSVRPAPSGLSVALKHCSHLIRSGWIFNQSSVWETISHCCTSLYQFQRVLYNTNCVHRVCFKSSELKLSDLYLRHFQRQRHQAH